MYHNRETRRGVAAVEFAIVLPLILLLLVGALEGARGVMVTHALQEAAHAGCRVYSVEETTQAQATAIIDQSLANAGVSGYTVSFTPSAKASVDVPLEPVTVSVTVPYANVAWLPPNFLSGAILRGECVLPADVDVSDGGDTNGYVGVDDDQDDDGFVRHEDRHGSGGDDDDD